MTEPQTSQHTADAGDRRPPRQPRHADPVAAATAPIKTAGYGRNCRIERVEGCEHNEVYCVTDPDRGQRFHITLDSKLHADTPRTLGLAGDTDLYRCRDTALDDALAANLALQCRLRTI
ncbi:MAG: hypothetical protein WD009_14095 [Phycisphaeraceae bacterium]